MRSYFFLLKVNISVNKPMILWEKAKISFE